MNNSVASFLKKNGFTRMEKNSYANDLCNVVYEDGHYIVADNEGGVTYSKDENIYWLAGFLTWYGYIKKKL